MLYYEARKSTEFIDFLRKKMSEDNEKLSERKKEAVYGNTFVDFKSHYSKIKRSKNGYY